MAHSTYTPKMAEEAEYYVSGGYAELDEAIPTVGGLALLLKKSRPTLYEWAKKHPEFGEQMARLKEHQELELLTGGLRNVYNPAITKLILATNHGYSDRQAMDHTSSDGSLTKPTRVELVAPGDVDSED